MTRLVQVAWSQKRNTLAHSWLPQVYAKPHGKPHKALSHAFDSLRHLFPATSSHSHVSQAPELQTEIEIPIVVDDLPQALGLKRQQLFISSLPAITACCFRSSATPGRSRNLS